MAGSQSATIDIRGTNGDVLGHISIDLLPTAKADADPPPLVQDDTLTSLESVQLLEGHEYVYAVEADLPGHLEIHPTQCFQPDKAKGRYGRLRTQLYTGILSIRVLLDGEEIGTSVVEVRSSKLDYLSDYQWMMEQLAEMFSGLVAERFAPSQQRFEVSTEGETATLYQRFAFLLSLTENPVFAAALQSILANPYRTWGTEEEWRSPGRPIPPSANLARQMARPSPRIGTPQGSLPALLQVQRYEETLDTPENRFVRFALTQWRNLAADVHHRLEGSKATAPVQHGLRETTRFMELMDSLLAANLFSEVGPMKLLPVGSQVLQKRHGYREILRAYVLSEAAAALSWRGGEDVYKAGQRNVATLYEFWVFVQLAHLVSDLCQEPLDWSRLIVATKNGLDVGLRRGSTRRLKGYVTVLGRRLRLDLWYNRPFRPGKRGPVTWVGKMDPDCSLRIRLLGQGYMTGDHVWIHFDAKYRVEKIVPFVSDDEEDGNDGDDKTGEPVPSAASVKRDDLLKMHAYRDAIRRTVGAYVIYPGSESPRKSMYHELLPGLGAFALRPASDGGVDGVNGLGDFLKDVIHHVAAQGTQHERSRYWVREANETRHALRRHFEAAPFLTRPPADTVVLLGYVRGGPPQWDWYHSKAVYNVRAGNRTGSVDLLGPELAAEFLLLYDRNRVELWRLGGQPQVWTRERMVREKYPRSAGEAYFCFPLGQQITNVVGLPTPTKINSIRDRKRPDTTSRPPVACTWLELMQ